MNLKKFSHLLFKLGITALIFSDGSAMEEKKLEKSVHPSVLTIQDSQVKDHFERVLELISRDGKPCPKLEKLANLTRALAYVDYYNMNENSDMLEAVDTCLRLLGGEPTDVQLYVTLNSILLRQPFNNVESLLNEAKKYSNAPADTLSLFKRCVYKDLDASLFSPSYSIETILTTSNSQVNDPFKRIIELISTNNGPCPKLEELSRLTSAWAYLEFNNMKINYDSLRAAEICFRLLEREPDYIQLYVTLDSIRLGQPFYNVQHLINKEQKYSDAPPNTLSLLKKCVYEDDKPASSSMEEDRKIDVSSIKEKVIKVYARSHNWNLPNEEALQKLVKASIYLKSQNMKTDNCIILEAVVNCFKLNITSPSQFEIFMAAKGLNQGQPYKIREDLNKAVDTQIDNAAKTHSGTGPLPLTLEIKAYLYNPK